MSLTSAEDRGERLKCRFCSPPNPWEETDERSFLCPQILVHIEWLLRGPLRGLDPWQLGGLDTLPGCVPDGTGQDWLLPRSPVRGFSFLTPPLEASRDLKSRGP